MFEANDKKKEIANKGSNVKPRRRRRRRRHVVKSSKIKSLFFLEIS
jgi:hypothetical protein